MSLLFTTVFGKLPFIASFLKKIPAIIIPSIAPVDDIPITPKLVFSLTLLSFFIEDMPDASANINGTVIAPVVAPEASNAIAIKL